MLSAISKRLALALSVAAIAACAPTAPATKAPTTVATSPASLRIKLAAIYVDDQDKALRFYTEVLGFAKTADVTNGPYRWLTVGAADDPNGAELQLALDNNPPAKAYQQALFAQHQPAANFYTTDVQAAYERLKARGATFTMPPTDVTMAKIAMVDDTCGNLIQLTQLVR